ncbi:uroporphyrinogen-III C-methyltransferase [Ferrimonas balearica]|uniref:uroporphyrinogen-III C-methyltransferase n=1 Tax=Ferrimonas balearica TaxID=44012 RepID=UPI001C5ACF85|nr:uroporphyrinogen-III C-methyltransferase [Ferrimonas balearica]MBW3166416.1 uroporphyrinogen-III C-methyltransferase [Ferrimonas balearica]
MEKTPKDPQDPQARPDDQADVPANEPASESNAHPDKAVRVSESAEPHPGSADLSGPATGTQPEPEIETAPAPEPEPVRSPESQPTPVIQHSTSNGGLFVGLVALIIAIGAAVFVGWQWQQEQQLRQDNAQLSGQLQELRQAMNERSATLERRIERGESAQGDQQQALVSLREQQLEAQRRAAQRQPSDWVLAEADYLVRMASRKVWLEHDTDTALALLKDADNRLQMLGQNDLLPLREALADDMAALSALPRVDRAGLSLGIESLIKRIDALPLNTAELPEVVDPVELTTPTDSVSDWRTNLARSWHALTEDFITVRRRQGQVQPLMAPEQEWYLREHIKGKLMQAQLSLYQGHSEAFREAVGTARGWMRDYFDLDDSAVQGALAQLDQWHDTQIGLASPVRFSVADPLAELVSERLGRQGVAP